MARTHASRVNSFHGFSLLELMAVLAVAGIVASLGMAGMRELVIAERARNDAVKLSTDLRRHRSEAAQRKMHTYVEMNVDPSGGTRVTYLARRFGSETQTPCELMESGVADVQRTVTYPSVTVAVQEIDPLSGTSNATRQVCFNQFGAPRNVAMTEKRALDIELQNGTRTALQMMIDPTGAMISSDSAASTGIASTGLHPVNIMESESAPVPPGAFDEPPLTFFETDPGIYIEAGGGGGDSTGGVNPCDPHYGACPAECVLNLCSSPCEVCYNPCSDPTYYSTYICECDYYACCTPDPYYGICP